LLFFGRFMHDLRLVQTRSNRAALRVAGLHKATSFTHKVRFLLSFQTKAERAWGLGYVCDCARVVEQSQLAETLLAMHAVGALSLKLLTPRLLDLDINTVMAYMGIHSRASVVV